VLKTVNLNKRIQQGLIATFTEVVNLGQEDVNPKELWNWIQNVCKNCPPDSSEGLCIYTTETNNKDNLDKDNLDKDNLDKDNLDKDNLDKVK
jgi:hypothetical protein